MHLAFSSYPGPSAVSLPQTRVAQTVDETNLLEIIERGEDHIEPEELAERLTMGDPSLLVVDVRTPIEFDRFHISGAVNVPLSQLMDDLQPHKNTGSIVLYSNGMTHPAQARDVLARSVF